MKLFPMIMTGLVCLGMATLAWANPTMLPKHPGYPSRGEFANDTGQQNLPHAQSLQDAARSGDANIVQQLEDPSNPTLLRQEGAGRVPIGQEPTIKKKNVPLGKAGIRRPTK